MIKKLVLFLFVTLNIYACGVYTTPVPVADVSIDIYAKKDKTSFHVVWDFKPEILCEHDKNDNKTFDKDEQEDIKKEYIDYIKTRNHILDIVYVKKGEKVKKSLAQKIKIKNEKLEFSKLDIKYSFDFNTDFVLQKNHRLFVRILDPKLRVDVLLKEIKIHNYKDTVVIAPQDIRANIYFYNHKKKYHKLKDALLKK
jgi:hypothetical protein